MKRHLRNPWILIPCGVLAATVCCLIAVFASCQSLNANRGTPQLSTTVESIQLSPVVTAKSTIPVPTPKPESSSTSVNEQTPTPISTSSSTALLSCKIVDSRLVGDGGDQDWSSANGLLAFDRKDSHGVFQLYVGQPESNDYRCLTCESHPGAPLTSRHKNNPVWDPTGEFLIVQGEMKDHPLPQVFTNNLLSELMANGLWSDIYATTPDGSKWFKLTNTSQPAADGVLLPAFSPDGSKLMWSRMVKEASPANPFGVWRLLIADFVVQNDVPRLENTRDITPPDAKFIESHAFSPDGSHVMFTADIHSSSAYAPDIWTLDLATGVATNLTHDNVWDEHAVYSLDGSKIVYMSSSPYPGTVLKTDLMIMNVDGSDKHQFSHFNGKGYPEYVGSKTMPIRVSWNQDGTKMAVTLQSGDSYPDRTLWIVTFAGRCSS